MVFESINYILWVESWDSEEPVTNARGYSRMYIIMINRLARRTFYIRKRGLGHSDNRDVYRIAKVKEDNVDSAFALGLLMDYLKHYMLTTALVTGVIGFTLYKSKHMRKKFDLEYLKALPTREYEAEDYDFKSWEVILSATHADYGPTLTTEQVSKDHFVLLYHGTVGGAHTPMQRFARLQRYISLRKDFPLKSVFICLSEVSSPEMLHKYAASYSKELLAGFVSDSEIREELKGIFQNLGCVYVLEKGSGNVICIIDPSKHPLESLASKLIYSISKYEDLKTSRELIAKNKDIRSGQTEALEYKPPTY